MPVESTYAVYCRLASSEPLPDTLFFFTSLHLNLQRSNSPALTLLVKGSGFPLAKCMRVGFVLQAAFASSAKNIRYALSANSYSFSGATMALGEKMQVKKLSDNAVMPVRGSEHAAGFDLARCVSLVVWKWVGPNLWTFSNFVYFWRALLTTCSRSSVKHMVSQARATPRRNIITLKPTCSIQEARGGYDFSGSKERLLYLRKCLARQRARCSKFKIQISNITPQAPSVVGSRLGSTQ